jgi:hypothetical protein
MNPTGYPDLFSFTPTLGADGSMTYTSTSVRYAKFRIYGRMCQVILDVTGTTGGSASISLSFSLPVSINGGTTPLGPSGENVYIDGGNTSVGFCIAHDSNTIYVRKTDSSNWGIGSERAFFAGIFYQI